MIGIRPEWEEDATTTWRGLNVSYPGTLGSGTWSRTFSETRWRWCDEAMALIGEDTDSGGSGGKYSTAQYSTFTEWSD